MFDVSTAQGKLKFLVTITRKRRKIAFSIFVCPSVISPKRKLAKWAECD